MATTLEKIKGCMFGGAIGDALGYPVEFKSAKEIFRTYGENGICEYEIFHGKALISDDTQMTLFTANGLLIGYTRACLRGIRGPWQEYVRMAYKNWLKTQDKYYELGTDIMNCWLMNCEELYSNRAPGNTCLAALEGEEDGSICNKINHSKGCGGVMRVAPVGLYLPKHMNSLKEIDMVGAEVAAITHGHPLGYIPAATLTHIIARCVTSEEDLSVIVNEAVDVTKELFAYEKYIDEFCVLMRKAIRLAGDGIDDLDAIRKLGEGWVAEEALAIAIYCALKYKNDFVKGVVVAVNHDGDSDSTGAITGNILGVYLGIGQIPARFIESLELKEVIEELSGDMYEDCKMSEYGLDCDKKWWEKYGEIVDYWSQYEDEWVYEQSEDRMSRFLLGKKGNKTLICCGVNPSTASPNNLDPTMKNVAALAKANGYDSYLMINLYPMRATNPKDMHKVMDENIVKKNLEYIAQVLATTECDIWAAWGNLIKARKYLKDCLKRIVEVADTYQCNWYTIGQRTKEGHPHHPLYLNRECKKESFDIHEYIRMLK